MAMNSSGSADGGGMAQQAAGQAQQAAGQAQQVAGQALDQAKQQASTQLSQGKSQAAEQVGTVAQALRQTGDQLREQEQEPVAKMLDGAAQRLEQFSDYLRHTDVNEMVRDVEGFARRQPAAFIGGAFTIGVLAARFLKSSGDNANGGTTALARRGQYGGAMYDSGARSRAGAAPTGGTMGTVGGAPGYGGGSADMTGKPARPGGAMYGTTATDVGRQEAGMTATGGGGTTDLGSGEPYTSEPSPVSGAIPTGGASGAGWGDQARGDSASEKEREGR